MKFQQRMLAKGLCPNCGVAPRGDKTQMCAACTDAHNARTRQRRLEHRRASLCRECGAASDKRSYCAACSDRRNAKRREARARTTPDPREPPRRTGIGSEKQDTPESSGLALIGPTKPQPRNNQFKHEETPLCSRIVTQYELRKLGGWVP